MRNPLTTRWSVGDFRVEDYSKDRMRAALSLFGEVLPEELRSAALAQVGKMAAAELVAAGQALAEHQALEAARKGVQGALDLLARLAAEAGALQAKAATPDTKEIALALGGIGAQLAALCQAHPAGTLAAGLEEKKIIEQAEASVKWATEELAKVNDQAAAARQSETPLAEDAVGIGTALLSTKERLAELDKKRTAAQAGLDHLKTVAAAAEKRYAAAMRPLLGAIEKKLGARLAEAKKAAIKELAETVSPVLSRAALAQAMVDHAPATYDIEDSLLRLGASR